MSEPARINDDVRIWWATPSDASFVRVLLNTYRDFEFFWVPDYVVEREIAQQNILCFDYRRLEAGYLWVTFPLNGKTRINQLAVDEVLWRNKVGTHVIAFLETHVCACGGWAVYLSCNSTTPGHDFWPALGYFPVVQKEAGRRGGQNIIWAKLLRTDGFLLPPTINEIKSTSSYRFQSSITKSNQRRKQQTGSPPDLFIAAAAKRRIDAFDAANRKWPLPVSGLADIDRMCEP